MPFVRDLLRPSFAGIAASRRGAFAPTVAALLLALVCLVGVARPARALAPIPPENELVLVVAGAGGVRTETKFEVEVVDTDETRSKGLMFRKSMPDDHGMLFDFRREEPVYFWMKNTYIPLDMIFIAADGRIVSIAHDTTPLSEATVSSRGAVRYVLEVNAGTARRLHLSAGDTVRHARIMLGR